MIRIYYFILLVFLNGCAYFVSWDEQSQVLLGENIEVCIKLDGPPDTVTILPHGNKEYKYHFKKLDPSCIHYWIVNKEGIITGYHYRGYCRPI
ncbi:hypothetical protein [uncultured Shewanella sp.]|uniref:hypothetical protein n=1 Tax=uncultured Shewanella sp. TaxID=173975 RepID=UPI00261ACE54|nr:hypothetical protein [uncultured Shewanella sp.]